MPMSFNANEINYISNDFYNFSIDNIDQFFLQNPEKKNIIWAPKVKGKSKYTFSIPKNAYLISKNHADAADLFYLSEQIDTGLKFKSNKSKNIDILISENNSNLILSQSVLSDVNIGLFLKNKEKISFGVNLNKETIMSKNALGNFGIEQAKDEYTVFNVKFVKLITSIGFRYTPFSTKFCNSIRI